MFVFSVVFWFFFFLSGCFFFFFFFFTEEISRLDVISWNLAELSTQHCYMQLVSCTSAVGPVA